MTRLSQRDFVEPQATTTLRSQDTLTSVFIRREGDLVEFEIHGESPGDQQRIQEILDRVGGRLARLLFMPPAWDSFEGKRTTIEAAQGATEILLELLDDNVPEPAIVPGSDGSLQLEWHLASGELEINIESRQTGLVFYRRGHDEWERELAQVRPALRGLVGELTLT